MIYEQFRNRFVSVLQKGIIKLYTIGGFSYFNQFFIKNKMK